MDMSAATTIRAPIETVYRYVTDPANDVNWRTGVTESGWVTDPPLTLGSEGYVQAGTRLGTWRATAIEPGASVDWDLKAGPFAGTGGYRFEDTDTGTRFTLVATVEPKGLYRLLGPLFGRLGRKRNQADVERLKTVLEDSTTSLSPGGGTGNVISARRVIGSKRGSRRVDRSPSAGLPAAVEGAALLIWHTLVTPFIGRRRRRWGTIGTEATDPLPGDDLVPAPKWSYTLGVTVDAPPEVVWPWIAQVGQGRGGFYTYQMLENLVGCRITNTTEILPEHQHPRVGDDIHLHWDAPPVKVELVDPPNALVLLGAPTETDTDGMWGISTWQFIVTPYLDGRSRLLTRGRYDHGPDRKSRLLFGRFPLEVISFVMSRRMMIEMKRLAERPRSGT